MSYAWPSSWLLCFALHGLFVKTVVGLLRGQVDCVEVARQSEGGQDTLGKFDSGIDAT